MDVSKEFLMEAFGRFNRRFFRGNLPLPVFVVTNARSYMGKFIRKREGKFPLLNHYIYEIRISPANHESMEEVEDTLIHEMIHFHISYNKIKDTSSHGRVFRRFMEQINEEAGRHLVISKRMQRENAEGDSKPSARRKTRQTWLQIVRNNREGKLAVCSVAKNRIFDFWNMPLSAGLSLVGWYTVVDDYFSMVPRSVKVRKFYHIKEEEWQRRAAALMELEKEGPVIRVKRKR